MTHTQILSISIGFSQPHREGVNINHSTGENTELGSGFGDLPKITKLIKYRAKGKKKYRAKVLVLRPLFFY